MKLTKKEVEHIAKLARLKLSDNEVKEYQKQLGSILEYVQKLQELKTDKVPELAHVVGGDNVFRDDEVEGCEEDVRKRIIVEFPRKEGELLEVQAVFEDRTE